MLGIAVVLEILQRTDYDLRRFIFFFPHFYSFSFYLFTLLWVRGIEIEESGVEHRKLALRVRPPSSDSGSFFFQFRRSSSTIFYFLSFCFLLFLFFRFLFLTLLLTPAFSHFPIFPVVNLIPYLTFYSLTALPEFSRGPGQGEGNLWWWWLWFSG